MRIYLDVSCLNRPFDSQQIARNRFESEALSFIFELFDVKKAIHVSSQVVEIEVAAMPDLEKRRRVRALLPPARERVSINDAHFARALEIGMFGIKPADALHIAAAESLSATVLLTCDDRLLRAARRHKEKIRVLVENPVKWLEDRNHASDS